MSFNEKILEKLAPVFKNYDLKIVEQRSGYLKLESPYAILIIAYNEIENSSTLWLGRSDKKSDKVEVDNDVLSSFFHSDLKLSQVPVDVFINNLGLFFEHEAKSLFSGDGGRLYALERFDLDRSQKYTSELLERQNLSAANMEWEKGNYKEFIDIINRTNMDKLPSSYHLKYKIANRKIGNS